MDGFWERARRQGQGRQPVPRGFLQLVAVAETDAQRRGRVRAARRVLLPQVPARPARGISPRRATGLPEPDQSASRRAVRVRRTAPSTSKHLYGARHRREGLRHRRAAPRRSATDSRTMRQAPERRAPDGVLQIGSMPHELAMKNIELFGREVLPHLQTIWDDEGWENHWWPKRLGAAARRRLPRQAPADRGRN